MTMALYKPLHCLPFNFPCKTMTMATMTIHNTTQSLCKVEMMNRSNLQINAHMDMDIHPKSSKIFKPPRPDEELYILCNGSRLHVTHIRANMFVVHLHANGNIIVVDRPII